MKYYEKLKGRHVSLASISLDDSQMYCAWKNDTSELGQIVFDTYKDSKKVTEEEAKGELNDLVESETFAIIDGEKKKMIGLIGLTNTKAMNNRSNAWLQMDPTILKDNQIYKGREALELFLDYCHNIMNLHNVLIEVPTFNEQLLTICQISNMEFMGKRDSAAHYKENNFYDLVYFQSVSNKRNHIGRYSNIEQKSSHIKNLLADEKNLKDIVTGDRIKLAKYQGQEEYIPKMATFLNDPDISIPLGEFKTHWNDCRSKEQLENVDYLIEKGDKLIGYVNLFGKDLYNHKASLEIMIGDKDEQHKGYGEEALHLFLDEQQKNGPYVNIESTIFEFNDRSKKMHEKIGCNYVGTRKEGYFAYGKLNDMYMYEMNLEQGRQKIKK